MSNMVRTMLLLALAAIVLGAAGCRRQDAATDASVEFAYTCYPSGGPLQLVVADTRGRVVARTTPPQQMVLGAAALSPDGQTLAYGGAAHREVSIFTVSRNGAGMRQLTHGFKAAFDPAYSADGARIAFCGSQEKALHFGIYVMNADGTGLKQLVRSEGSAMYPAFTPDGRRVLYCQLSRTGNRTDLCSVAVDGSGIQRYRTGVDEMAAPAVSSDGRTMVFNGGTSKMQQIYLMRMDGGGLRRLTGPPGSSTQPSFSPDGTKIVFNSNRDGGVHVFVMNADGTGQRWLIGGNSTDFAPRFAPQTLLR